MPMIVFRVFVSRKCEKWGRRAGGTFGGEWGRWGRARGQNGQMEHGGAGWAHWWARMEREMEAEVGGRFCRRGPLPMIVCNEGAGTVRPASTRPETGAESGRWGSHWECRAVVGRVFWAWWVADGPQVELHALIVARAFYGGKCGRGGDQGRGYLASNGGTTGRSPFFRLTVALRGRGDIRLLPAHQRQVQDLFDTAYMVNLDLVPHIVRQVADVNLILGRKNHRLDPGLNGG